MLNVLLNMVKVRNKGKLKCRVPKHSIQHNSSVFSFNYGHNFFCLKLTLPSEAYHSVHPDLFCWRRWLNLLNFQKGGTWQDLNF